jgi:predicted transcriptional regulator
MRQDLYKKVIGLLEETPGQAIKEISVKLKMNRTFLAGYLQALEDMGYIVSRKVGPAKIFTLK